MRGDDVAEGNHPGGSRTVHRAVELLKVLARSPQPLRFAELERAMGIPKGSLHALLTSLVDTGMVERSKDGFHLGIAAFEMGTSVPFVTSAREAASQPLDDLHAQTGEACHFGSLSGGDVLYLDRRDSIHSLRFVAYVGARKPAYGTALGKAMLSLLEDKAISELYPVKLPSLTPNTLPTLARLIDELTEWRQRGYAIEHEESTAGVSCIGVAFRSGPSVYGLSITAPSQRVSLTELQAMQPALTDALKRIESVLAVSNWLRVPTE